MGALVVDARDDPYVGLGFVAICKGLVVYG